MATGHSVKESTDAGMPPLRAVAGDTIALLDATLLPGGYWQKVFSAVNVAVYRATTGQRWYLRVDDTVASYAYVRAYISMTDVDTGTLAFPTTAHALDNAFYFYKGNSASLARYWQIVLDSRFFALVNHPVGTESQTYKLIFGEGTPYDPLDGYFTMLWASAIVNTGHSTAGTLFGSMIENVTNGQIPMYLAASSDGTSYGRAARFSTQCYRNSGSLGNIESLAVLPIKPVEVTDLGSSLSSIGADSSVRGTVPYVYAAPVRYSGGDTPLYADLPINGSVYRPFYGWADAGQMLALIRTSNDEPGRA